MEIRKAQNKSSYCSLYSISSVYIVCDMPECSLSSYDCVAQRTDVCKPWHYHLLTFRDIGIIKKYSEIIMCISVA
jgi:hypothetical protein